METVGFLSPETATEASESFVELGSTAETVVKETAKAMDFDREEFEDRLTGDVVATAHEALFASLLAVHVGTMDEFDGWQADYDDYEVTVLGSDQVDNVVWHPVPFAGEVVAATFQNEREAAVGTLRRQAFGRIYREALVDE